MGGFGNVLFQILAFKIAKNNNISLKYIDVLTKKNIITKLLGWKIHERLYDDFINQNDIYKVNIYKVFFILIIAIISKIFTIKSSLVVFYNDKNKFLPPYANNIFGYFQDKEFLEKNKEELLKLGREIRKKYIKNESYIVVHYRYGDSVWAKEHELYYQEVRKLVKEEKETVMIATDSPKDALEFFRECNNIELTKVKNAFDDFKYMISAHKLYCAPSTFSWWAAHSLSPDSKIIIPEFFEINLGIYINKKNVIII